VYNNIIAKGSSSEKQAAASEKHQRGLEDVGKVLQAIETSSSSRHDSSVAQNELLLDSINQIKARLDVGTLKPPSSMADGKYPSRSQSVTSLGGFTMVENDSSIAHDILLSKINLG
jgi:hypothetical protein